MEKEKEDIMNTHGVFELREGEKDKRIGGGGFHFCTALAERRHELNPSGLYIVRELTERELK